MPINSSNAFEELQRAVAGRFSLQKEIGRGGMGIVFLAQDILLDRPVAIKMLLPELAAIPGIRERFLKEAHLAAGCFHPNIVPVHEVGEAGSLAWFVMAWVKGETLAERIVKSMPLTAAQVTRLATEVGLALDYAHKRGLVHRDIKPANILIEEDTGRALLADFGIAQPVAERSEAPLAGTALFMAPEQLSGLPASARTDIYSLGISLRLAAGPDHATRLPSFLAAAISRCIEADPQKRFASVTEFLDEIAQAQGHDALSGQALLVREQARGTAASLGWVLSIALTGAALIAGEEPHSIGRALTSAISQIALAVFATAAVVRAAEAALKTRRALRKGLPLTELQKALQEAFSANSEHQPKTSVLPTSLAKSDLLKGAALAAVGVSIALLNARTGSWQSVPDSLVAVLQIVTIAVPAILVNQGVKALWRSVTSRAEFRTTVSHKAAAWLGRRLGRKASNTSETPSIDIATLNSPTEFQLAAEANAILNRLPAPPGLSFTTLRQATAELVKTATELRRRDYQLAQLQGVTDERRGVRARLSTAIAALEAMRLDLIRLEHNRTLPGSLTGPLEAVRDLQRHVDAMDEIRQTLAHPSIP